MDLKQIWDDTNAWYEAGGIGPLLVGAVVVLVGGWLASKIIKGLVRGGVMRAAKDQMLANFVANIAYRLLMLIVLIAFLNQLGVDTTSLAALIAAAGLAIGFALQDSLKNFAAGVLLILFRPFNEGDVVEAAGVTGKVDQIEIFATTMTTPDNKAITVPNGAIFGGVITNYTRHDTRRVDLVAGIGYGDDVDKAVQVLEGILKAHPLVLDDPAPAVAVIALADSSVNINVRPWCKTDDYWTVYSEVTDLIKKRFDAEGINIPFPQRDVHMHQVA
jgi:small conductance mechanosensitive channel